MTSKMIKINENIEKVSSMTKAEVSFSKPTDFADSILPHWSLVSNGFQKFQYL